MASTNSLNMIERKIKELQARAEEIRRNEQQGMEQLRAVIDKYRLGPGHLKLVMGGMSTHRGARPRTKSKVAPKYRHPDNAAIVWSGRGRKPSWVVAALKSGRTIDEFLIRGTPEETSDQISAVR